jgi:DNA polymerase-3 subunit alpha
MYTHLKLKSEHSICTSTLKIKEAVSIAKKYAMETIAICDDGNLFGSLEFANECVKYGIKPIIGVTMKLHKLSREIGEISIYAKNAEGYANILQITNSEFAINGSGAIPIEVFEKFCGDIIAISPSIEVLKLINPFFTKGEIFAEFSRFTNEQDEIKKEADLVKFACENSLPLVATNASYFESEELFPSQDALLCVKTGRFTVEEDRQMFTPNHNFKTEKKFEKLFKDIPHAVLHTNFIAEKCNYYPKPSPPILPKFADDEHTELEKQARDGLTKRLTECGITAGHSEGDYISRLEYEIGVISNMGFAGYFLIVSDFIKWSKANEVAVGPGRGSGAGSLVAYCLEITDLDPLRYGLLFERFLNPERVSMPDFDIDFCQEKRYKVIDYVQQKYGSEKVASIVTFGRLQARAVLKDVGRVIGIPYLEIDRISKMIPQDSTLAQAIATDKDLQQKRIDDDIIANLLDIGTNLEGVIRNTSTHAAGIIISNEDLRKTVPLIKQEQTSMHSVGYEMKTAEKFGLVKFDFLGLRTLTVIKKACELINKNVNAKVIPSKIPLDDLGTFEFLRNGDLCGIFQLDSKTCKEAMKHMKIDKFNDIIALTSLNRPGPKENIPSFISRKLGDEEVIYPHPLLEEVLKETYGIIIYQEQVIKIAQVLAGYSLGEADLLRRAMGKKDKDEMDKQKERFINGAKENSIDAKKADEIFALVEKFAGYGFNKSHAAAYSVISFQTAYLKAHYPLEFYTSLLNLDIGNTDNLNIFIAEARQCGIEFITPNVNTSSTFFKIIDGKIEYALSAIKGVGEMATFQIENERKNGNFTDVFDFAERLGTKFSNKKVVEGLAKAGGFLKLHPNTNEILQNIQIILSYAEKEKGDDSQFSLFGDAEVKTRPTMKQVPKMTANEALLAEFEAFGFYLSSHPLVNFTHKIAKYDIKSFKEMEELRSQSISDIKLKMAGVITVVIHKKGASGRFAFVKIGDLSNIFEVAIFSEEIIMQNRAILKVGSVLVMNVTASMQGNGSIRLLVNDIASIENEDKIQQFKVGLSQKSWQKKAQTPALEPILQQKQDVQFLQCNKILIDAELFETHTNKPFNVLLEAVKMLDKGNTQVLIKLNGFNAELGISVKIPMEFIKRLGNSVKII